ncbi:T-cell-specific guanine nucleotide triphosphate-binding protein 2-like [Mya arenaria]|uniref:T-cell-specific guanine nucleotide triphosphate-binding protein 2-like n=1 Tax=Mya arenaria TaxID=6604 RepID=UPI0022E24F68|nr:T-cell-specific guanine nucleotide triphosphate-binding protein 2-like [Mya arenaria]
MEVKEYPHPKHKNFVLYDLPGVGTQQFPRESYVEKVNFNEYDFYMILSATRFTENDAWLGQKVKEQGKKFFFVRTKIDTDMYNEKKDSGVNFNEERSLRKIREDAERNLRGLNAKVYLISTELRKINLFDFDRLMQDVIEGTPQVKKESLVFILPSLTENVILEKEKALSNRALKMAIAAGIAGLTPLPGVSELVDIAILSHEAEFYRKQFNLDEKSIKEYETEFAINIDTLGLITRPIVFSIIDLLKLCAVAVAGKGGKIALTMVVGLDTIIAGITAFQNTLALLQDLLKKLKEDALKINYVIAKRLAESIPTTTHTRSHKIKGRL